MNDTFAGCLDAAADRWRDRDAIVLGNQHLTFHDIAERSIKLAAGWQSIGVTGGDRVGLWLENGPAWIISFWALARIGATVVPLSTRWTDAEICGVLTQAQLKAILVGDRFRKVDFLSRIQKILRPGDDDPAVPIVVSSATQTPPGIVNLSALCMTALDTQARMRVTAAQAEVTGADVGIIQFTSGSTAFPKGAILRQGAMIEYVRDYGTRLQMTPEDRVLCHMPFFHIAGINHVLLVPAVQGAAVITAETFDPTVVLAQLATENCNVFGGVATMCFLLADHAGDEAARAFSKIDKAWVLGASNACRKVYALTDMQGLVSLYGATELSGSTTFGDVRDPLQTRLSNAGRPMPGIETRIVDIDRGVSLAPGETGEIWHRGRRLMAGYFGLDRAEWNIDGDGWFHTGDLGSLSSDGYLTFAGRQKEMLKVGGENVACPEIEDVLMSHPAVKLVAAVGVDDERLEEVPVAFVELRAGASGTAKELIEHCTKQLSGFKVPRRIFLLRKWPMTPSNKIQKNVLRKWAINNLDLGAEAPSIRTRPDEGEEDGV